VRDPLPIYIAANGPKALQVVGELGDGWITALQSPDSLKQGLAAIRHAVQQQGHQLGDLPIVLLTTACVTQPGESHLSPRVLERVGPFAIVLHHLLWAGVINAAHIPEEYRTLYRAYELASPNPLSPSALVSRLRSHANSLTGCSLSAKELVEAESFPFLSC
jgi:hypothetical protein